MLAAVRGPPISRRSEDQEAAADAAVVVSCGDGGRHLVMLIIDETMILAHICIGYCTERHWPGPTAGINGYQGISSTSYSTDT